MNAQILLENFGYIADAPGGVKRLREMILQLAVTGTLTNRDQNDTEAEVLFRLNQQHRDRLIEKKELQAQKPLPQIDDASVPWVLPDTWKWCRLGQVTSYGSTNKAEYSDVNSEVWVLELEDIEKETSRLLSKVRAKDRKFRSSKNRFTKGQILYGKLRPYLDKVLIADEEGICTTEIIPILPFDGIIAEYLRWYLKCPYFKTYANNSTHGMNLPRLGTEFARLALFAFPPIKEQKRIVAKVDELMTLCDKLEAQQQERERRFPVLSRTCHACFVESPSLDNLKAIFDEAETVSTEDIRKTILSLAVQSKLVQQNPEDEGVESLLAQSDQVRKETAKSDRRVETSKLPLISTIDKWEIANSWSWRALADLVLFIDYRGKTPTKMSNGVRLLTAKNVRRGEINLSPEEFLSEQDYHNWMTRGFPKIGDVLFTTEAPMGNAAVVNLTERFALAQRVICFRSYGALEPSFLAMQILSDQFQFILDKNGTGMTAKGIKAAKLKQLPIAVPPLAEQRRIVAKVTQLMALIDKLEAQQARKSELAQAFAQAAVAAITGTEIKKPEKMKAPKTELVSRLQTKNMPNATDSAPLTKLLTEHDGELPAKALWQRSGLEIDAFYQQLRTEMANGWIIEPKKAIMKEIEAD